MSYNVGDTSDCLEFGLPEPNVWAIFRFIVSQMFILDYDEPKCGSSALPLYGNAKEEIIII